MKRTIIPVVGIVILLALIAGAVILLNELVYAPSTDTVRESFSFGADEAAAIDIDINIGYINVFESPDAVFAVDFSESRKGLYKAELVDGAISVTEGESSWVDKLSRRESEKCGVEIGVPAGTSIKLRISASVSDITVDGVTLVGDTELTVETGSVSVNGVETDGSVSAVTTTGNVEFGFIDCSEISANVATGDVSVRSLNAEKSISIKVVTGKVTGRLTGTRGDYTVSASVNTGVCGIESGGSGKTELNVSVTTGSIALDYDGGKEG